MNQVMTEVLLTCVILSLLICAMPLYHGTLDLMAASARELLTETELPAVLADTPAYGADVLAIVDYYAQTPDIAVTIRTPYGEKTYTTGTFAEDPCPWPMEPDQPFLMDVSYAGHRLTSVLFIQEEE